jgi:hypothetical protein
MTIAFLLLLAAYALTVFYFRNKLAETEDNARRQEVRANHWSIEAERLQDAWALLCREHDKATLKLERLTATKKKNRKAKK